MSLPAGILISPSMDFCMISGILLFQLGQLVFNIADLRGRLLQPRILLVGELLFSGLDGIQQEVAVVFCRPPCMVMPLSAAHEHLLPEFGIFRQVARFPAPAAPCAERAPPRRFRLAGHGGAVSAHIRLLIVVLCAAGARESSIIAHSIRASIFFAFIFVSP